VSSSISSSFHKENIIGQYWLYLPGLVQAGSEASGVNLKSSSNMMNKMSLSSLGSNAKCSKTSYRTNHTATEQKTNVWAYAMRQTTWHHRPRNTLIRRAVGFDNVVNFMTMQDSQSRYIAHTDYLRQTEFHCAITSLSHAPQYGRTASPTWHVKAHDVHPEHGTKHKEKITQRCNVEIHNAPYNPKLRQPYTVVMYGKYNCMVQVVPHVKHVSISLRKRQVSVCPCRVSHVLTLISHRAAVSTWKAGSETLASKIECFSASEILSRDVH